MATIRVDQSKTVKAMKPLHGGGQPPLDEPGVLAWAPHADFIENNTVMLIEW